MTDPVALQLGPLSIRWYGVFVALGFLAGYQVLQRRARALGLGPQVAPDVTLAAMVGGIVGARLLYVVQNWEEEFGGNLLDAFAVWHGGLVFYGGFLGAVAAVVLWGRHKRWPLLAIGDMVAPALPLGHVLGRIGCLLNGCCFGRPWDGPLGVAYPGRTADGLLNGPLYVQRALGWVPADATACVCCCYGRAGGRLGATGCSRSISCSTRPCALRSSSVGATTCGGPGG
jgi:phosphatidylglycerol:prolipoprotein diacylglycerol transferase